MAEILVNSVARRQLGEFAAAIIFFHASEYVLAAVIHGRANITLSSLLISKQYVLAMVCGLLEYVIELEVFPELKNFMLLSNIGLFLVVVGEIIRKSGVLTAGRAFTHTIRLYHEQHHELVTHGIYRFMRHPGYCGFFLWAIGTQVLLCNPICVAAFAVVTWRFFYTRIPYPFLKPQYQIYSNLSIVSPFSKASSVWLIRSEKSKSSLSEKNRYEEFFLRQFFGSQYEEYAQQVSSGLPFIR